MEAIFKAKWIKSSEDFGEICPLFIKEFSAKEGLKKATLQISGLCVYAAFLNGDRIGKYVLAPGWTSYKNRLQYQTYDVTALIKNKNILKIGAGQGWLFHNSGEYWCNEEVNLGDNEIAIIGSLILEYNDNTKEIISTDKTWNVKKSKIAYSNMYNGESYDSTAIFDDLYSVTELDHNHDILIPQEGEEIREKEKFNGGKLITTPKGEIVLDFMQEITGYVEFKIKGKKGQEVILKHFEVLDSDGNVYTENLRKAKQEQRFICDGTDQVCKPFYTFYGFRYIQIIGLDDVNPTDFTAIAVYSDMRRTGYFTCSDPLLNKLYENILWGQRGNFLDVPTDCPQRDERLGWTGDAQAFIKTASINYDVYKFFKKWLRDMKADQTAEGGIHHVIPSLGWNNHSSAGWADAACICPWQLYLSYGKTEILEENFDMMRRWVDYVATRAKKHHIDENFTKSRNPYIWSGDNHFGDWLAVDVKNEESENYTDKDLIATAFFANSCDILIKAGQILGKDMGEYKTLYNNIVKAYRDEYINDDGTSKIETQGACVFAIAFNLTTNIENACKQLVQIVRKTNSLMTGFLSTPYLLHCLDRAGETKLAYDLIFRKEYPSWLNHVLLGATTMWERWNSIKPDGSFEDAGMNSFNHYAYGAVGDWMFGTMAGIQIDEENPAYKNIIFKPITDDRLTFVRASIKTKYGEVKSEWQRVGDKVEYYFTLPNQSKAKAIINNKEFTLKAGENIIIM